eukprot:363910-Chlamydomonas_euryale.AAC.10
MRPVHGRFVHPCLYSSIHSSTKEDPEYLRLSMTNSFLPESLHVGTHPPIHPPTHPHTYAHTSQGLLLHKLERLRYAVLAADRKLDLADPAALLHHQVCACDLPALLGATKCGQDREVRVTQQREVQALLRLHAWGGVRRQKYDPECGCASRGIGWSHSSW